MNLLYAHLNRLAAVDFAWGDADCMTAVCDWLVLCGWPDPMADVRGLYHDPLSCERATGFIRNPVGVTDRRFAAIGVVRGNQMHAGDVAIVQLPGHPRPVGAIWTGASWAAKGERGTVTVQPQFVQVLAFWSVGYRP
jgi:hypothetical protein